MAAPNPLKPVKGAKTTLWLYAGNGDPFANPLVDIDWSRMANIKDLQPGELSADAEDNNYLDDENADWKSTAQGQKSAGDTTVTLAWKPGEDVQKKLLTLFDSGEVCTYKIKYPNGTVDLFNGWISSLGKTTTQFLASIVINNLPPRPFNIRMIRTTPDSNSDQLQNKTMWSSYTEIIDIQQCYPNTAVIGLQVDAEQFGSQQVTRNYHLRGRIVQVPSNYDPKTRTYMFMEGQL